ncbi:DegT/DnrJ/EryC1/StrS family aminotransferase [Ottowia thiooxydans]|uniref:DegT/DnrJ/EryC1/StrS family aminotransferase n=1 Tax=Ottowia thiooxydans TaxID=219182 RepID=UPI00040EA496|nr:aminotransferase class I/II-fold pyridoxal phosphate-dependent enzyme [Ottowia thiooxydans]
MSLPEKFPPLFPAVFGRPLLPQREVLIGLIDEILDSNQLSNCGSMHNRLEDELTRLMGKHLCLTSSGTMALMMALRLGNLRKGGEVITSPLSFAASAQAIEWCGFKPVFADVECGFPTLDPAAVEKAITPNTVAILGVHFMGIACDTSALERLASQHKLWLVFDGAQTPDIKQAGQHLAQRGDATILSLHATKLLNTAEGGAVVVRSAEDKERLVRMRNFGLYEGQMVDIGINGKLSEIHSAMGLASLPLLEPEISARHRLRETYQRMLAGIPGVTILKPRPDSSASHLYFALSMPKSARQAVVASAAEKGFALRDSFSLLCGPNTLFENENIVCTGAAALAPEVAPSLLALPMHSKISDASAAQIALIIKNCAVNHLEGNA